VPIEISDPSASRSLRAAALAAIWPSVRFAPVIALIVPVRFRLALRSFSDPRLETRISDQRNDGTCTAWRYWERSASRLVFGGRAILFGCTPSH